MWFCFGLFGCHPSPILNQGSFNSQNVSLRNVVLTNHVSIIYNMGKYAMQGFQPLILRRFAAISFCFSVVYDPFNLNIELDMHFRNWFLKHDFFYLSSRFIIYDLWASILFHLSKQKKKINYFVLISFNNKNKNVNYLSIF